METCVVCGAQVALAESELTGDGVRCRRCSLGAEVQGHVLAVAADETGRREAAVRRRADYIARAHFIIWLTSLALYFAGSRTAHIGLFVPLALVALVPIGGLLLRQRWAWRVMVGVDGALAAALLAWSAFVDVSEARFALWFVAAIPALLVVGLVGELRSSRTIQRDA